MNHNHLDVKPGQKFDVIVHPATGPLQGSFVAQPSKNYTTRYILAAALGTGTSQVLNCATSADSAALQRCVRQMGAVVDVISAPDASSLDLRIKGFGDKPGLIDDEPVNPGNAGAVLRFLLGVAALLPKVTFVTDHPQSLGKRPNQDILDALEQLGCRTQSNNGMLPITLNGGNLQGGAVTINGSRSSQFLSGLLFLAPMIGEDLQINVVGELVSKAPINQTLEVLKAAGISVTASIDRLKYEVRPGLYNAGNYSVNGDWPGSAALLSAAAVTGGSIQIEQLFDDEQGEKAAADVLDSMGATVESMTGGQGIRISGNELTAVNFDGDLATDAVLALMGAAAFAKGRTRFYNVSNLRIKECDRISEPIKELRKLGVQCWEGNELGDPDPDAIIIEGNPAGYEGGVTVDGRDDHRVIMLLSIVALKCRKPVRILRAHQVAKSYPGYFTHLSQLGAKVEFEGYPA